MAYLPNAEAQARQYFKDVELVRLTVPEVDHLGVVDLVSSRAFVGYSFRARGPGQGDARDLDPHVRLPGGSDLVRGSMGRTP